MKRALAALCFLFGAGHAHADYLSVGRPATLKDDPDSDASIVARFDDGDLLALIETEQTNGYYKARARNGDEGWIYRTLVRRHLGEMPEGGEGGNGNPSPSNDDDALESTTSSSTITARAARTVADVPREIPAPDTFRIHLIDVGTGLAILVQGHDFNLLFDGGSGDDKQGFPESPNESRLVAYLYAALGPSGDQRCAPAGDDWPPSSNPEDRVINHVFLSHPHDDHGSMLDDVLACYRVEHIWDSGANNPTVFYENFIRSVATESNAIYHTVTAPTDDRSIAVRPGQPSISFDTSVQWTQFDEGDHIVLGDRAWFDVLFANGEHHDDPNQNSTVIRVQLGDTSLLLTGDAESGERAVPTADPGETEAFLLENHRNAIDVDILQVGHHGSMTSSRRDFLEAVTPAWALIGAGPKKYRTVVLPDREIVEELQRFVPRADQLLVTNPHDASGCEVSDWIGTDEPSRPGGCDNYIVSIQ